MRARGMRKILHGGQIILKDKFYRVDYTTCPSQKFL